MYKFSQLTLFVLLSGIILFLPSCKKDVEEEMDEMEVGHQSVIINSANWETVATSDLLISGRQGYSFESDIEYLAGGIENGAPHFLAKHYFHRSGSAEEPRWKYHSALTGGVLNSNLPTSLTNTDRSALPDQINQQLSSSGVDRLSNNYFFLNGKLWAQSWLLDDRFNTTYPNNAASMVRNMDGGKKAWMNYISSANFPTGYLPSTTTQVGFINIGIADVVEENGEYMIYMMGDFKENSNGNLQQRAMVGRKEWNSNRIEMDKGQVVSNSTNLTNERYPGYQVVAFDENQLFGVFFSSRGKLMEVYYGGMNSALTLNHSISDISYYEIVKGKNEFFLIYSKASAFTNQREVVKFERNGQVQVLGTIEQGVYSYLNGELVVGNVNSENEIDIYKVTAAGVKETLAAPGDLVFGRQGIFATSDEVAFASDNNDLYVAIQNWKSPKYRGAEQFGGWEIIKFKP